MEPYPASPEPAHNPSDKGAPPPSVQTAVKLIWVSIALGVLSSVLSFVFLDDIIDQTLQSAGTMDRDAARAGAIGAIAFGLVISVAIYALLAYFITKGANWARIVWTVLAAIGLVFGLVGIANQPAILLVLSLVGYALTIATLVFLYRSDSNAYFKPTPLA